MSIRPQDVLLYAGGECFQRFGVPVWRQTRAQDVVATMTRSGAVGPFVGKDGVLRSASANRLRVDWIDTDDDQTHDTPTLLLEVARTNLIDSDDLTAWDASGTPVVTGSVDDPADGTGAYTVADDAGGAAEYIERAPAFTDGSRSVVFVVRENTMPASGVQRLLVRDTTAGSDLLVLDISAWSDGEPTLAATTGTLRGTRYIGNGYWAIYARPDPITGANNNEVRIVPAVTASETGSIDVYRVNAYNANQPPVAILDASETRNADLLMADFLATPQEMTVYAKFIERGSAGLAKSLLFIGGTTGTSDPRLLIDSPSNVYRLAHDNGTSLVSSSFGAAPSWGEQCEIALVLNADGSVQGSQSIEGAAVTTASQSAAAALGSAWSDTTLTLNDEPDATNTGIGQFLAVKIVRGDRTMAEMRNLFAYDSTRAVL